MKQALINFYTQPIVTLFFLVAFITVGCHIIIKICKYEEEAKKEIKAQKARDWLASRNKCIAENAISFMKENDLLEEFCEDRDFGFYDFEFDYFELNGYLDTEYMELYLEEEINE